VLSDKLEQQALEVGILKASAKDLYSRRVVNCTIRSNYTCGGKKVIEARKGIVILRSYVNGDNIEVKTNDYGPQCLKDLEEIYKAMYEEDLKPEVIEVISPYIYVREKRERKAKRFLEELGI